MSAVWEIEIAIQALSRPEVETLQEWIEDHLEDQPELSDDAKAKLAYYESTRDTASHFFIEYLPKGVYVFEYPVRIQQRGRYQTGIASIQCMYAPKFNSHSESFELEVK